MDKVKCKGMDGLDVLINAEQVTHIEVHDEKYSKVNFTSGQHVIVETAGNALTSAPSTYRS